MSDDLPVYSGDETTCQKCGHGEVAAQYVPALGETLVVSSVFTGIRRVVHCGQNYESMVRDCSFCGFAWDEQLPTAGQKARSNLHAPYTPKFGVGQIIGTTPDQFWRIRVDAIRGDQYVFVKDGKEWFYPARVIDEYAQVFETWEPEAR